MSGRDAERDRLRDWFDRLSGFADAEIRTLAHLALSGQTVVEALGPDEDQPEAASATDLIGGLQRILQSFKCECDEDHWQWLKLPCNRCAGLSNLKRLSVLIATPETDAAITCSRCAKRDAR